MLHDSAMIDQLMAGRLLIIMEAIPDLTNTCERPCSRKLKRARADDHDCVYLSLRLLALISEGNHRLTSLSFRTALPAALKVFLKGEARPRLALCAVAAGHCVLAARSSITCEQKTGRRIQSFRRRSRASARRCRVSDHHCLLRPRVVGRNHFGTVSSSVIHHECPY